MKYHLCQRRVITIVVIHTSIARFLSKELSRDNLGRFSPGPKYPRYSDIGKGPKAVIPRAGSGYNINKPQTEVHAISGIEKNFNYLQL